MIHAGLGDEATALQWVESAYEDRSAWMVFLRVDPRFERLRSHARYQDLTARMGLVPA